MKTGEPGARIVVKILLAAMHRAQPHDAVPLIDPGRTPEGPDTEAIDHRLGDGENALLSLPRRRSDATQLIEPAILNVAHADVQARYLKAQILRQATDRGCCASLRMSVVASLTMSTPNRIFRAREWPTALMVAAGCSW